MFSKNSNYGRDRSKGKTLLGIVNKLFVFKSLMTSPSKNLPLHLSCPKFEFSLKVMGSNPSYLLKNLFYPKYRKKNFKKEELILKKKYLVQLPGGSSGAHHIIPALHNVNRNV